MRTKKIKWCSPHAGFEPATFRLTAERTTNCANGELSRKPELNQRLVEYYLDLQGGNLQSTALPTELSRVFGKL